VLIRRWYPIAFLFAVLSAVWASVQRPSGTKGDVNGLANAQISWSIRDGFLQHERDQPHDGSGDEVVGDDLLTLFVLPS